jgi:hypothetical protein
MLGIQQKTADTLRQVASRLRETALPGELSFEMEKLAGGIDLPCVIAVVGRVKAGKSTFINALLGEDLARVGTTETTATINYFRYTASNPERPVRCHWRGGRVTEETREFLDSLQGNDDETLRRADGIEFLEFLLPNPHLRKVTLVDTPGTNATVNEHQDRLAEFINLRSQLRQRHDEETRRIRNEADAVIYLIGPVARANEQEFLDEFAKATGGRSRAFNAVGVMSKIDLQPAVMERRRQLSQKIAAQLADSLNTVIPVSAGLHRTLERLVENDRAELRKLARDLRRIPPARLEMLLLDIELFTRQNFKDCPLTIDERQELLRLGGAPPWGVFTTVARAVAAADESGMDGVIDHLREVSGFAPLASILEQNFFMRGDILRCYRIVNDARRIMDSIRYVHIPKLKERERENLRKLKGFLLFIERSSERDWQTAGELRAFVTQQLTATADARPLEKLWEQLDGELSDLYHELTEYNSDFDALRQLDEQNELFSPDELDELRPLLGLYGISAEKRLGVENLNRQHVRARQMAWRRMERVAPHGTIRRLVAERAQVRYGLLLGELSESRAD